MRRTRPGELLIAFAVVFVLVFAILPSAYSSLPRLQWISAVPLAALVGYEAILARRIRAAVGHRPDAKPVPALTVARAVALAKASMVGGAALLGAAAALLAHVAPDYSRTAAARHDTQIGVVLVLVLAGLVVTGRFLERCAVDPGPPRQP